MKKIDTFSANSLKILDKSTQEFENKYIHNLYLHKKDKRALIGQKFHSLICFYIQNIDTSKLVLNLNIQEQKIWEKLKKNLDSFKQGFIKTEYPFLIKENLKDKPYYLTGRFDAIHKENETYTIYDWKTLNIPKSPKEDLQSIVYLFCANKIFKTDKIKLRYLSIEKLDFCDVFFEKSEIYKKRIDEIVLKQFRIDE